MNSMPTEMPIAENAITKQNGKSSTLTRRGSSAIHQTLDLFFPTTCQACGTNTAELGASQRGFCPDCECDLLANDTPSCLGCAAPLPLLEVEDPTNLLNNETIKLPVDCPVCREEKWKFAETIALGPYRDLLRHLVLKSKQRTGLSTARSLGILLANHRRNRFAEWLSPEETVLVPIPSHWTRRIMRGGNSPDSVAEGLATTLGLRTRHHLKRTRRTAKQTELAPTRRTANVRSAFQAQYRKQLQGKRILLVDDIFTTGATLSEATKELLRAGAGQVIVVVLAKRTERL